jgi:hypothetical protein
MADEIIIVSEPESNDSVVNVDQTTKTTIVFAEETGDKIEKVGHVTKLKSDKNN